MNKSILFLSFFLGTMNFTQDKLSDQYKVDEQLRKLSILLKQVSPEKMIDYVIERERIDFLLSAIDLYDRNSGDKPDARKKSDPEGHFFEPKQPQSLMNTRLYKHSDFNETLFQRIEERYMGEIPEQVKNIINFFKDHDTYIKNGIRIFNRLLLHGKPGVGKSHLVKVLADELEIPLLSFSASFFSDKYIGESARRIRRAFQAANDHGGPIFLFIDELDALAPKRNEGMHQEHRATLVTLLTELQDLQENPNVFIFAATNDIDILDPALKDRFAGSLCEIKKLNKQNRAKLIRKTFEDFNYTIEQLLSLRLADVMEYFGNREIQFVVMTALLRQAVDKKNNPTTKHHLCHYIRKAIKDSGKHGEFRLDFFSTYSDGI